MTTVTTNTFTGANEGAAGGYVPLTTIESAKMDADLGQVKADLDTHLAALQAIYVKLDTIESSAKDDQNAVELVALINASASLIDANNLEATVARLTNVSAYIETHRITTTAGAMHTEASIKSTGQTYSYTPTSVVTSCQNILDEINNVRAQIHKMLGQTTWIDTPGTSIATIKSKLDGIEAGATADQTAAEIRTLVGNATDSNVFTDANNSKLSGIATSANNYVHPNHSGDVTSTGDGATVIANDKVTYAKMQNVTATDRILGRSSAGAGDVQEITCTATGRSILDDTSVTEVRTTLGAAALASPTFTGVPAAPTAAVGTNTTQLATTAFVQDIVKTVIVKCIPDIVPLTVGDGKIYFTIPVELNGMNLVTVGAHVYTVSSSGLPTFQIHNLTLGQDVLSTKLSIDVSEKDTVTATTASVINTTYDHVATGNEIRFDCDIAGTGTKGMEIRIGFRLP